MLVIVQARFSSARLPGKVLLAMAGKPMLGWVSERVRAARRVTGIVVATSADASDDPVAAFCRQHAIDCFRGSLNDVAARLVAAAEWANTGAFVRVSGDSPLIPPAIIDDIIALFECARPDLATNVQLRTFPKGMSAEAISVEGLRRARVMMRPGEEEHVTQTFYRCPERFRIVNLTSGHDWGAIQMSVDTAEDFSLVEQMLLRGASKDVHAGVADTVALRAHCLAGAVM